MTAQNSEPVKHRMNQADRMKGVIALNDQQYSQVKEIEDRYRQKHRELRNDTTDRGSKHESLVQLRKERRNEIELVLTPDQRSKWSAYKQEQKSQRKEYRAAQRKKMEEKMRTELSLTDDQQARLRNAHAEFRSQIEATRSSGKSAEENKSALKTLREQYETKIKSILSPEQYEKWKVLKKERANQKPHRKFRGHRR